MLCISDLQASQRSKPQPFEFQILGKFVTLVIVLDCSVRHFNTFRALLFPAYFTTEQNTVEASLFVISTPRS